MSRVKVRKLRGYWNEKIIIKELEIIIFKTNHFPSANKLREMNRQDLEKAMIKHGGINYFRELLGYKLLVKSPGYWNEENTIIELEIIIKKLGYFPTQNELCKMKKSSLSNAILKHGGVNYFRELLKHKIIRKSPGYWNEKIIFIKLETIIEKMEHFPTIRELKEMNRSDLLNAISKHGGLNHFREFLGHVIIHKHKYWSEEKVIFELELIIEDLNHFPTTTELKKMGKMGLGTQISERGGVNYFRNLLGCEILQKSKGYWTEEMILPELELIIEDLNHFPTNTELIKMNKYDLIKAISEHGGINHFRKLFECEMIRKSPGYWTEEIIFDELESIIKEIGHFPTQLELINMNKQDLQVQISRGKGFKHFWKVFGVDPTQKQKNKSKTSSYVSKRGLNSENIVKELITKWCYAHDLSKPKLNVKLSKGNVIEFVCESDLRVGIDVTNTKSKNGYSIQRKWKHKQYHLHLDELWIVVFSDVFDNTDYTKFNIQSPDNVKIMSIETFMEELGITVDNNLQLKIDNYNACTFHNKDELIIPKQGVGKYFKIKPDIRIEHPKD
ncbi:hypothetical protein KAU33_16130 [Candidatus Dependentiae bacterium]|nr:hypothetical protein [Candidatus Dependentiae bacterium]